MVQKVNAYMLERNSGIQFFSQYFGSLTGNEILYRGQIYQQYNQEYKPNDRKGNVVQYL